MVEPITVRLCTSKKGHLKMRSFKDVPIPERMQHLPRDPRGYPIPHVVVVDRTGVAHFVINDHLKSDACMRNALCHICGQKLDEQIVFVGGPRSAFHSQGAFYDGPMHHQCATYALQVCPYLAMPSYTSRNTDVHEKRLKKTEPKIGVMVNPSVSAEKPVLFVMVVADGCRVQVVPKGKKQARGAYYFPDRPYARTEFWRDGAMIDHTEGRSIAAAIMRGEEVRS